VRRRSQREPLFGAIGGAALALAAIVSATWAERAEATERQFFFGATPSYGYLDEHYQWFSGVGVVGEFRYGFSDAFDFIAQASVFDYPTGSQIVPGARAGVVYVVDISRFLPYVGATIGIDDVATYSCPDEGSRPCGHVPYPTISIPAAFDYRVTKHLTLGAHFEYSFLFASTLASQISIGGAIMYSTAP
jgi:hypothetical protein